MFKVIIEHTRLSLDQYANSAIDREKGLRNFKLIESNPMTTLGGAKPAHKLVYTYGFHEESPSKVMQVFTIKDNKVYTIEYSSSDQELLENYLPIAQKMIDTFEITENQSAGFNKAILPPITDIKNVTIYLNQGRCLGTCPVYSLRIDENGTVIYTGYPTST
jgi:hypothetical protein